MNAPRTAPQASSTADAVRRIVDAAPPFTPAQRDRIATLLRSPQPGSRS